MHDIFLIEDGCCHPGELDPYAEFLKARLGDQVTITKVGVGGHLGFAAVPPELGNKLLAQGANAVPIVAVDGRLLHNGAVPDWEASLLAVKSLLAGGQQPSPAAI